MNKHATQDIVDVKRGDRIGTDITSVVDHTVAYHENILKDIVKIVKSLDLQGVKLKIVCI